MQDEIAGKNMLKLQKREKAIGRSILLHWKAFSLRGGIRDEGLVFDSRAFGTPSP